MTWTVSIAAPWTEVRVEFTGVAMATKPCPGRGAVVTYLNPDVMDPAVYVRGVIIGAHVVDPQTSHAWVPVMRPDHIVSVLDATYIVRVHESKLS